MPQSFRYDFLHSTPLTTKSNACSPRPRPSRLGLLTGGLFLIAALLLQSGAIMAQSLGGATHKTSTSGLGMVAALSTVGYMPTHASLRDDDRPTSILAGGKFYVDSAATGANNGTSWADAYTNPQAALAAATSGDTVFVAKGTYKPDVAGPGNRNLSFGMKTGVVVLGGFPTGGGTLASRNWVSNPTILSGDIGTAGVATDNSYHVVRCASQQGELNGFIVE
jgi:hypothetical protein